MFSLRDLDVFIEDKSSQKFDDKAKWNNGDVNCRAIIDM